MRLACKGHISSEKERDVVRRYLGVLVFVHISKAIYSLCLLGVDAVCQLTDMVAQKTLQWRGMILSYIRRFHVECAKLPFNQLIGSARRYFCHYQ
ncbi:Cysteine--tRNA ligase [Trichinella spiralis]|uniref:Cysteine--tRNA ligase n=1 Tax=Trichinella spiralis TaxID=6334 RepID=A0ABR3K8P3_TRISP